MKTIYKLKDSKIEKSGYDELKSMFITKYFTDNSNEFVGFLSYKEDFGVNEVVTTYKEKDTDKLEIDFSYLDIYYLF